VKAFLLYLLEKKEKGNVKFTSPLRQIVQCIPFYSTRKGRRGGKGKKLRSCVTSWADSFPSEVILPHLLNWRGKLT